MYLPLNVLLFQLSDQCTYQSQNVDLTRQFEGIKLFNAEVVPDEGSRYLYLVSEGMLASHGSSLLSHQILSDTTFLCICRQETYGLDQFHSSLSLVLLRTDEPFVNVFNRMLSLFSDMAIWDKDFHLSLLRQNSMQSLLELSKDYLRCPILVLNRKFMVLGQLVPPGTDIPLLEEISVNRYVPVQLMNQLRQSGSPMPGWPEMLLCWYHQEGGGRCYVVLYRFQTNNRSVGYALLFCGPHPLSTDYLHLLHIVFCNLNLYFQRERFNTLFSAEEYEGVLVGILEHPDYPAKQYEQQLAAVPGLTMEGHFALARLEYDPPTQLPHSVVGWNLRSLIPELRPFVWNGRLYLLRSTSTLSALADFLTPQEKSVFCGSMGDVCFLCAVSQPFFSLMELPAAAEQCEAVVNLSRNQENRGQVFRTFGSSYGLYLLEQAKRNWILPVLRSPHYEALRRYDEAHHTDLCTLFMYFLENQRSINRTAAAVYLHRNTVMNRIKKAVDLMGGECGGCGAQTAFFLSYLNDHPNGLRPEDR